MQVRILHQIRRLDENALLVLFSLFRDELESALAILDEGQLTRYEQRRGFMPTFYTTPGAAYFITADACTCPSFQVKLRRGGPRVCKHVLAAALAENCGLALPVASQGQYEEVYTGFTRQLAVPAEEVELSGPQR